MVDMFYCIVSIHIHDRERYPQELPPLKAVPTRDRLNRFQRALGYEVMA